MHNLFEHLACCDLALVQGGLSTCMELVATRRPFLSFPLQRHFEQCVHVRRRLANYGADRAVRLRRRSRPSRSPTRRSPRCTRRCATEPVETDGAARAARRIAEVLTTVVSANRIPAPLVYRHDREGLASSVAASTLSSCRQRPF